MHLYDHGIDIVQLFNPFQIVMAHMKKKVDRLLLQKVKATQRGGGMVCFGNLLNGMVNIGIMDG
jgi:hypothetical protein